MLLPSGKKTAPKPKFVSISRSGNRMLLIAFEHNKSHFYEYLKLNWFCARVCSDHIGRVPV